MAGYIASFSASLRTLIGWRRHGTAALPDPAPSRAGVQPSSPASRSSDTPSAPLCSSDGDEVIVRLSQVPTGPSEFVCGLPHLDVQPQESKAAGAEESGAMDFAAILSLILRLAIPTVLTVQQVVGDVKSGADKKTMAQDALSGATQTALSVLTGDNAAYAGAASVLAGHAIDAAVTFTKATGAYQAATDNAKATAAAAAAQPLTPVKAV